MRAHELLARVEEAARRRHLDVESHPLSYRAGDFRLLKLRSPDIHPTDRVMLIQAGIHGDEIAGPVAFADHFDRIVDAVHAGGLKLIAYPLVNPSGFEAGVRYNVDHDPGPEGNSDFLRYELLDGRWVSELAPDAQFRRWVWSSELRPPPPLPVETALMHRLLRADPLAQVIVALDLHQDHLTPGLGPAAYHYAFGDLTRYAPIVDAIARRAPVLRHVPIGAGFDVRIDEKGAVTAPVDPSEARATDEHGFIVRHDGSFSDLFFRLGAAHSITSETSGATPLDLACEIAVLWIEGLACLAGDLAPAPPAHGTVHVPS